MTTEQRRKSKDLGGVGFMVSWPGGARRPLGSSEVRQELLRLKVRQELSGWPNVSISKQKGIVRVAMAPPRVEGSRECALTRVRQELSGWPNASISKQKGTV